MMKSVIAKTEAYLKQEADIHKVEEEGAIFHLLASTIQRRRVSKSICCQLQWTIHGG
jgi:hypothetical protein